ncbi:MAG: hypothetical protein K1X29_08880 [Bdellovibrionales bacterium]|nr:hypothetical protein [Bdellovibrionales bacterium]
MKIHIEIRKCKFNLSKLILKIFFGFNLLFFPQLGLAQVLPLGSQYCFAILLRLMHLDKGSSGERLTPTKEMLQILRSVSDRVLSHTILEVRSAAAGIPQGAAIVDSKGRIIHGNMSPVALVSRVKGILTVLEQQESLYLPAFDDGEGLFAVSYNVQGFEGINNFIYAVLADANRTFQPNNSIEDINRLSILQFLIYLGKDVDWRFIRHLDLLYKQMNPYSPQRRVGLVSRSYMVSIEGIRNVIERVKQSFPSNGFPLIEFLQKLVNIQSPILVATSPIQNESKVWVGVDFLLSWNQNNPVLYVVIRGGSHPPIFGPEDSF